ncbi:hypothetical protein FOCG_15096 [Fusarium oxysporum f. sp. radicis-lycopersici 26381]|nr:hypothetical protein FOWG_13076 [Fusarium oxysporum f. sp. lycopersici MN25]EXL42645.1 hypothetical protein FOCG_15096 [Fusarium oxysporum f. sp. radicis-lycopersici 26381]
MLSWVHQDPGNTISQPQHAIAVPDAHRQDSAEKKPGTALLYVTRPSTPIRI